VNLNFNIDNYTIGLKTSTFSHQISVDIFVTGIPIEAMEALFF